MNISVHLEFVNEMLNAIMLSVLKCASVIFDLSTITGTRWNCCPMVNGNTLNHEWNLLILSLALIIELTIQKMHLFIII